MSKPKGEELAIGSEGDKWCQDKIQSLIPHLIDDSEPEPNREFRVLTSTYREHEEGSYGRNTVSTAKYNIISFIPRALFEQFRRLANVYFLLITVLMMIGTYTTYFDSPLTPYTTLIPLIVVLAITMGKEGFEDLKRHTADYKTNTRPAEVLSLTSAGNFETIHWKDIEVGRIIRVHDRDEIPADVLLLASSEEGGVCYIETSNIDGETNLKVKQAARTDEEGKGPAFTDPAQLHGWDATLECEAPNARIHFFNGTLRLGEKEIPVDQSNLLLRGSTLRNTKWILGLVVYTGYDSKLVMNSRTAPSKLSTIERTTNRLLYLILGTQAILTTVTLIAYIIWMDNNESKLTYMCYDYSSSSDSFYQDNCQSTVDYSNLGMWFTFLILYNNFVPISLYVTVEMVNYVQAYYMDQDLEMYDPQSDTPAMARTSNMNGDLASVQYVFSDKTGTLTQNVMKLRRCSVGGDIFGNLEESPAEENPSSETVEGLELSELSERSREGDSVHAHFMEVLSVCHTVVVETNQETDEKEYQAESPDEEALVSAARAWGWEFTGRTATEAFVTTPDGTKRTYKILAVIPFTSSRKRMSVVVRDPSGRVVVLTKGADNVIFDRAGDYQQSSREQLDRHLSVFAGDGLRTLVLARKEMPEEEFTAWFSKFKKASTAVEDRIERIEAVSEEMERGLLVVGATAIEDKLQDGVPATIAHLLQAGIKVWVLTGDKMETAINIGYSCRLLNSEMVLIKIIDKGDPDLLQSQLKKLVSHFERLVQDHELFGGLWHRKKSPTPRAEVTTEDRHPGEEESAHEMLPEPLLEPQADAPSFDKLESEHLALVMDGPALARIFGDGDLERLLLRIATLCKSVVACRVSPAQKRMLVRLVKKGVHPKPITLAIGDGANDVAMIQEAQIGVGISGREGRQAVNSSDFAIAQFRFLEPLMLKHGRWNYRRISKVILYSFYKNIVLTMILFYYTWWTGFSGQSLFEDYVYGGYNFFLAMPIITCGIFDKDVSAKTISEQRWVYLSGRENRDLNVRVMFKWLAQAIIDSILLFFLVYGAFYDPKGAIAYRGYGDDLYMFGLITFSCMLMGMMYKAARVTYTWTWVNYFFLFGSIILYLTFLFAYGGWLTYAESFYWVPYQMFSRGFFWLIILLVPAVSLIIDLVGVYTALIFRPSPIDIAIEMDRGYARDDGEGERTCEDMVEVSTPRRKAILQPFRWAAGKLMVEHDVLSKLNATASDVEKTEMGIAESKPASSFDYTMASSALGPGAGAMVRPRLDLSSTSRHSSIAHSTTQQPRRSSSGVGMGGGGRRDDLGASGLAPGGDPTRPPSPTSTSSPASV